MPKDWGTANRVSDKIINVLRAEQPLSNQDAIVGQCLALLGALTVMSPQRPTFIDELARAAQCVVTEITGLTPNYHDIEHDTSQLVETSEETIKPRHSHRHGGGRCA